MIQVKSKVLVYITEPCWTKDNRYTDASIYSVCFLLNCCLEFSFNLVKRSYSVGIVSLKQGWSHLFLYLFIRDSAINTENIWCDCTRSFRWPKRKMKKDTDGQFHWIIARKQVVMVVCRIQALNLGQPQVSTGLHHCHTGYTQVYLMKVKLAFMCSLHSAVRVLFYDLRQQSPS